MTPRLLELGLAPQRPARDPIRDRTPSPRGPSTERALPALRPETERRLNRFAANRLPAASRLAAPYPVLDGIEPAVGRRR